MVPLGARSGLVGGQAFGLCSPAALLAAAVPGCQAKEGGGTLVLCGFVC